MSETPRPPEFDFPLSWSGPDGIGASPFDEFAEDEGPDVDCSDGQEVAVALRRTLGMFATGVTVITTRGELTKKLTVKAHRFSQSALDKIAPTEETESTEWAEGHLEELFERAGLHTLHGTVTHTC